MILKINDSAFCMAENTPFVFDEAQKSADAIRLIKNGDIAMEISHISDFSVYSLEGGEWTSPPQKAVENAAELASMQQLAPTPQARIDALESALLALMGGNNV